MQDRIELTDSPYVVANMRIMTAMGKPVLDKLGSSGEFVAVPRIRSAHRSSPDKPMSPGLANRNHAKIHRSFSGRSSIWSYGSGYGGKLCSGKNAWPCELLRPSPGAKAGWRSTCSSSV